METIQQDLRFAIRQLRTKPLFTSMILLMLGVGAALNAAMFSLVHAALLRPLPFTDPERIVAVWEVHPERGRTVVTPGNFLDFRENNGVFQFVSGSMDVPLEMSGIDEPERVETLFVLPHFFGVLDVPALSGRTLESSDYEEGWEPRFGLFGLGKVAVLSERFWRRRFGADPSIVGRDVRLDGSWIRIVGVASAEFHSIWPDVDVVAPWILPPDAAAVRQPHEVPCLARLAPGVTIEQASSVMAGIYRRFEVEYPESNRDWTVNLIPLQESLFGSSQQKLLVLQGAATLVFLLISFNVANLLMARSEARRREMAIRRAVGASSSRIFRQVLTESVVLGLFGGLFAAALCAWALPLLTRLAGSLIAPFPITPRLDGSVLAFTLGTSLMAALVFGLAPALLSARSLRARSVGVGKSFSTGAPFAAAQVAVALVLLVSGALLFRGLVSLERKSLGFEPDGVLALEISLPESRYREWATARDFIERVLEEIRSIPGVSAADTTTLLPMRRNHTNLTFAVEGRPSVRDQFSANPVFVSPGYLATMGVPLLAGRFFDAAEREGSPWVLVVNETMAKRFWPGEDPVGKRVRFLYDWMGDGRATVIGVAPDVRYMNPGELEAPSFYMPHDQIAEVLDFFIVVRTSLSPLQVAGSAKAAIHEVDPELPMATVQTMNEAIDASFGEPRLRVGLIAGYALLGLAVAALGLFAVLTYSVARRTSEFGIRVALGAGRYQILGLVLGQGLRVVALGLVVGMVLSLALGEILESQLVDVAPTDPTSYVVIVAILILTTFLASALPARSAARANPVDSLRHE